MVDFVRNFIEVFGNEVFPSLTREANRRMEKYSVSDAIPCVFYGSPPRESYDFLKLTGTDFVTNAYNEWGDENQICVKSYPSAPEKFENHLIWFYSKVNPAAVLINKYDSEYGSFIGVRFKIVRNGKIRTFSARKDIDERVVFDNQIDGSDDQITWQQLWEAQDRLAGEAVHDLLLEFPELAKLAEIKHVLERAEWLRK
jgi:hypothetical protein